MSGTLRIPGFRSPFNHAGAAGPLRLAAIAGSLAAVVGAVVWTATLRKEELPQSRPGSLPTINPLPGGMRSNPQQDALAVIANQEQARRAAEAGQSYTPVMPASRPYVAPPEPRQPEPRQVARAQPAQAALAVATVPASNPAPATPAVAVPTPAPARVAPAFATPQANPPVVLAQVQTQAPPAAAARPQDDQAVRDEIRRMINGWQGRPPRTDVVIPPVLPSSQASAEERPPGDRDGAYAPPRRVASSGSEGVVAAQPASYPGVSQRQNVLIPGGRIIYAHPIMTVNSDQPSEVVLQADTGPIQGARMIGNFTRERNRLIIRVTKAFWRGQEIGLNGVVVAPGTNEVGVASSVDQNYVERLVLPAAADFVRGLGQAIAISNQQGVIGPLGSISYQNRLNLDQQLGIAAGTAAAGVGTVLREQAPRGPTVTLDQGVSVGVLFLGNVTASN